MKFLPGPGAPRPAPSAPAPDHGRCRCGLFRSHQAGRLALGLCALFALEASGQRLEALPDHGGLVPGPGPDSPRESGVDLDAYDEGAWSILHSQLTKLLTRLREQADRLQGDKDQMAAFLADVSPPDPDAPHGPEPSGQPAGGPVSFSGQAPDYQPGAPAAAGPAGLAGERPAAHVPPGCRHRGALPGEAQPEGPYVPGGVPPGHSHGASGPDLPGCRGRPRPSVTPAWTAEALGNVLKNCMEHTPASGSITVTLWENPIYSQILVEDTGPGIRQEDLLHLFERFYRGQKCRPPKRRHRPGPGPDDHHRPKRHHPGRQPPRRRRPLHHPLLQAKRTPAP